MAAWLVKWSNEVFILQALTSALQDLIAVHFQGHIHLCVSFAENLHSEFVWQQLNSSLLMQCKAFTHVCQQHRQAQAQWLLLLPHSQTQLTSTSWVSCCQPALLFFFPPCCRCQRKCSVLGFEQRQAAHARWSEPHSIWCQSGSYTLLQQEFGVLHTACVLCNSHAKLILYFLSFEMIMIYNELWFLHFP